MVSRLPQLQRFFYSHYFFGGVRQAIGVLLPALLLAGVMQMYVVGIIASIGASCVAVLDQPGGPRRYGRNGMLAAILLGSLTALITGFASSHSMLIWLAVPLLSFLFSMFSVFGKQGGLLGFACMLIMTLTMRTPLATHEVLTHTLYSFAGGFFYFSYSLLAHRLLWHREIQQALSAALFATADYMATRSRFYDVNADLETSYRQLIHAQSAMTEKHQAARDTVLRELPRGRGRADQLRARSLNVFIDMVALLDTLVATHTDYATLRRTLPDSDVLLFGRDALRKLSRNVSMLALDIVRNKHMRERSSVKAELRAIEYELEKYRQDGMAEKAPEVYALLVQVLRRLRNASHLVNRMAEHMSNSASAELVDLRLEKSMNRFVTRQKWRLGMLTSNLRMDSSHCRYALRVGLATLLAMTLSALFALTLKAEALSSGLSSHSYWIILTIIVVMKPGFALTRQRNGWRLAGTLIGCVLALILFNVTQNTNAYLAVLIVTCILGYSLVQLNFMMAAIFNTIFVLMVFHFIAPSSNLVIGERLVDTFAGCAIALLCSYVLPWWEYNFMASLANALKRANLELLNSGLEYARLSRQQTAVRGKAAQSEPTSSLDRASDGTPDSPANAKPDGSETGIADPSMSLADLDAQQHEAEIRWRVARKNVHIAFSNFAAAFYRMMDEPIKRQRNLPELNHLLIQNHVLALQLTSAIPILASLPSVPHGIQKTLDTINSYLLDQDADPPASIETEGELATLAYPLRQMVKAAELIRQEMRGLQQTQAAAV
ncbi:FUSC family protein [Allopusillimonas ginsengisoli]|uniref:FUSC family protein n=1 Tax=Allopusillimonas ginsengisoli TaxID=453575 RepID=UPI00102028E0|nr:FUSC family protein [Allopusillimonas ginsengisoli]TEA78613.1 FUSC family protein [Allopusillimonas ginsengisoli]